MICKIEKCKEQEYRARMCRLHYKAWLETGELPGPAKPQPREAKDKVWRESATPRGYHANLLRLAEAVAVAAKKWSVHDNVLAEALYAYEEAKL